MAGDPDPEEGGRSRAGPAAVSLKDQLVMAIMDLWETSSESSTKRAEIEEHYNNYGDRGVVDLLIEKWQDPRKPENASITLYDVITEVSVRDGTSASEIIRQFKRHRGNFFEGSDYSERDYYSVTYTLVFYAGERTYKHFRANEPLYRTLIQDNTKGFGSTRTSVGFSHPDIEGVAFPFRASWGYGAASRSILERLDRTDEFITDEEFQRRRDDD